MDTLTDRERSMLLLAAAPFKYPAVRERRAREQFDLGPVHFWQEVNRLIDRPAAYAADPQTVAMLLRRRTTRTRPPLTTRVL